MHGIEWRINSLSKKLYVCARYNASHQYGMEMRGSWCNEGFVTMEICVQCVYSVFSSLPAWNSKVYQFGTNVEWKCTAFWRGSVMFNDPSLSIDSTSIMVAVE